MLVSYSILSTQHRRSECLCPTQVCQHSTGGLNACVLLKSVNPSTGGQNACVLLKSVKPAEEVKMLVSYSSLSTQHKWSKCLCPTQACQPSTCGQNACVPLKPVNPAQEVLMLVSYSSPSTQHRRSECLCPPQVCQPKHRRSKCQVCWDNFALSRWHHGQRSLSPNHGRSSHAAPVAWRTL